MLLAETRGRSTTTGLVDCGPAQFRTSFQIGTAAVTVLRVQSIIGFLGSTSLEFSEVCFPRASIGSHVGMSSRPSRNRGPDVHALNRIPLPSMTSPTSGIFDGKGGSNSLVAFVRTPILLNSVMGRC